MQYQCRSRIFSSLDSAYGNENKPRIERVQALADLSRSALYCRSNETRAPIVNPPKNLQLEGTLYHSPSYIRVRAVMWECDAGQTDTQTAVTTIHFASATPHAKCRKNVGPSQNLTDSSSLGVLWQVFFVKFYF